MQCPRCLNTDESYFYKGSKGWYCRKCISFGRAMIEEEMESVSLRSVKEGSEEYTLRYPLTKAQALIAQKCAEMIEEKDVLLHCVCGAGKTELVVLSIANMLKKGKKVCFAIPRRQVVLELAERLKQYFPKAKIVAVCGGHTEETDGDLIVCTTHQLYRYYRAFSLLILDEPDAFPFRGNEVLHGIAQTACKGHRIYLTATPDEELLGKEKRKELVRLQLNVRPHGRPLPVPDLIICPDWLKFFFLLHWIRKHDAVPKIIFVPTIRDAEKTGKLLGLLYDCFVVSSRTENRDEVISAFRREKAGLLVATTVMERGTTIENVSVCVFGADHQVFDEAGLVQMAGRAGRTFACPEGDVLFLSRTRSSLVDKCISSLKEVNQNALSDVL